MHLSQAYAKLFVQALLLNFNCFKILFQYKLKYYLDCFLLLSYYIPLNFVLLYSIKFCTIHSIEFSIIIFY